MMKDHIKDILFDISPQIFGTLFAIKSRRVAQNVERREGLDRLSKELTERYGQKVMEGPFAKLKLPDKMVKRHIAPFLFGSYESTLHGPIYSLMGNKYDVIIDIGSSFGYYASGFAKIFNQSKVFAFDTDPWARKQVREMASINLLNNLRVEAACTKKTLKKLLTDNGKSLVFSDCEGYEVKLFDEESIQSLKESDVIIELHPAGSEELLYLLESKFEKTHKTDVCNCETIDQKKKFMPEDVNDLRIINEWRSEGQQWLVCRPRLTADLNEI